MTERLADTHEPLTTKEGWRQFVDADPISPPPAVNPDLLGEMDRAAYQEQRLDYHARLGVVATPTMQQVARTGQRLVLLNRHQVSARRGLIVTGPAGTGKTTAITQLGKRHERAVRRHHPGSARIPVVYVTVPPAATARMLAVEFARFLGLPIGARANQADITNAVCGVLCDTRTELVLVDEIHNLNIATRAGAEVSDQLKYFSERIPATFAYAGIDVEGVGLFAGVRGRQIASRFGTIPTVAFPYGSDEQRRQWRALIATLEQALRLHRHPAGALLSLDAYLHERSGGMIGSLSHLVRGAAVEAILDGSEQITKTTLDAISLDHTAERARRRSRASRPRRSRVRSTA